MTRFLIQAVRYDIEELSGKINRRSVSEVTTVREVHTQDSIARLTSGEVNCHIGLGTGVRLNVCVLGTEEFFSAIDGQFFGDIDKLTATVVPL